MQSHEDIVSCSDSRKDLSYIQREVLNFLKFLLQEDLCMQTHDSYAKTGIPNDFITIGSF